MQHSGIYGCGRRHRITHGGNDNGRLSLFSIKYIRQLLKISLHQCTAHVPFSLTHTHTRERRQHVAVARPFTQRNYEIRQQHVGNAVAGEKTMTDRVNVLMCSGTVNAPHQSKSPENKKVVFFFFLRLRFALKRIS